MVKSKKSCKNAPSPRRRTPPRARDKVDTYAPAGARGLPQHYPRIPSTPHTRYETHPITRAMPSGAPGPPLRAPPAAGARRLHRATLDWFPSLAIGVLVTSRVNSIQNSPKFVSIFLSYPFLRHRLLFVDFNSITLRVRSRECSEGDASSSFC